MKEVTVWTDGSCWPNPGGPGGFAAILLHGEHKREISGGVVSSTNNRMELMAVIAALTALSNPCKVKVHSDSQYVTNGSKWAYGWREKGWKTAERKPVKNKDLWKMMLLLLDHHEVEMVWVKGHAGNEHNERCDVLAGEAAKNHELGYDHGYEVNN